MKRWELMPELIEQMAKDGWRPTGIWRALSPEEHILAETSRPQDFDDLELPEDTIFLQEFKEENFRWVWKLPEDKPEKEEESGD